MVKYILILCTALTGLAQTRELTSEDFWEVGMTADYLAIDPLDVELLLDTSGADVTWDLSGVTRIPSLDYSSEYLDTSTFTDAPKGVNVVERQTYAEDVIDWYYGIDEADMRLYKIGGTVALLNIDYTPHLPYLTFPTVFDTATTSNVTISSGGLSSPATSTVTYDSYGTLITPTGRFENTVLVKNEQVVLLNSQRITLYAWFAPGIRTPVCVFRDLDNELGAYYLDVSGDAVLGLYERFIPHLTNTSGGFLTSLLLHNPTSEAAELTLQPFTEGGIALQSSVVSLSGASTQTIAHVGFLPNDASHLGIEGCESCNVSVAYKVEGGGSAHAHETGPMGKEFLVYPGEKDLLIDGMAMVNLSLEEAVVTMTARDADNGFLGEVEFTIAGNSKALKLFLGLSETPPTVIHIQSSQDVVVLFLRLNGDSTLLFENRPFTP